MNGVRSGYSKYRDTNVSLSSNAGTASQGAPAKTEKSLSRSSFAVIIIMPVHLTFCLTCFTFPPAYSIEIAHNFTKGYVKRR